MLCACILIVYMGAIYMHIDRVLGPMFMYVDCAYACHIHVY